MGQVEMTWDREIHRITNVLGTRLDLSCEHSLQKNIQDIWDRYEIHYDREVQLSARDRIDFICSPSIGVEVKLRCPVKTIYRQLCRYAESPHVEALLLITAKTVKMPGLINGKPVFVFPVARGML